MNTEILLKAVVEKADEFKSENLRILKVADQCSFADYFVIMSGHSSIHIHSLAEALVECVKKLGLRPLSVEGLTQGSWCLLDFGDVIVHIFNEEKRQFFSLESFWDQAEEIPKNLVVPQT